MPKKGELDPNATERSKQQRKYNSKPVQKKRRAKRNKDRATAVSQGKLSKGDGKDLDHQGKKSLTNPRVRGMSANRADNKPPTALKY